MISPIMMFPVRSVEQVK